MNVLSLFNGCSCGREAFKMSGIEINNYFSSEIDKHAIKVSDKNYPEDIENKLGDVTKFKEWDLPKIDIIIGGSPCQDLSSSNVWAEKKGLDGEKSRLFWAFVGAIKKFKPKYFLLENVGSASLNDRKIIDEALGVEGVKFNSKLMIPQNRNRIYWTNIPFNLPVEPMEVTMQDLLEDEVDEKYYLTNKMYDCVMKPASKGWQSGKMETDLKIARPLTATMHKMHRADTDNYITGVSPLGKTNLRRLTPKECERLQGLPDDYTDCVSDTQRYRMLGNGWTIPVISKILNGIVEKNYDITETGEKQYKLFG